MSDRAAPGDARLSRRELSAVAAGFLLLTLGLTYPQARHMASRIGQHYDAEFSLWRLSWIAHQLLHDPRHLFDANIFFPAHDTLALSDAILLPGLLAAPFIWLGVNPIVVYNALVLGAFVASGVAMYALVRDLNGSTIAGGVAGAIFAFAPYNFGHYAQLELLWAWPIPLALRAFNRLMARRRAVDGVWLAVCVALQAWSCLYYAVFLVTALAILTLVLIAGRPIREHATLIAPLATAALVCAVLVAPYARPYLAADRTVMARSAQEVGEWSPTWRSFTTPPPRSWLYGRQRGGRGIEFVLFPGVTALALALIGLWPPVDRRRIAYGVLLIVAVDLSLGVNGLSYMTLYRTVGVYRNLRVPARLFVIVSAALAVLGAEGCARLLRAVRRPAARAAIGAALVGLVLAESAAMPLNLRVVEETPTLYAWLKAQPPAVVLEWPVPDPTSLGVTHEPVYMYYSISHWQTLVNGYSGNYPDAYIELLEHLRAFPSDESMAYLRRRGVDVVILHGELDERGYRDLRPLLDRRTDVRLERIDKTEFGEIAVYRLVR